MLHDSAPCSVASVAGRKQAQIPAFSMHGWLRRSAQLSSKDGSDKGTSDLGMLSGSDWLVAPEDIELCVRPDGSLHLLGEGGFGTVRPLLPYAGLSVGPMASAAGRRVLHDGCILSLLHAV